MVKTLWQNPEEAHHCSRDGTLQWSDELVATNDPDILKYFWPRAGVPPSRPLATGNVFKPLQGEGGNRQLGRPGARLERRNDSIVKRHFSLADDYARTEGENNKLVIYGYLGGFCGLAGHTLIATQTTSGGLFRRMACKPPVARVSRPILSLIPRLGPVTFLKSSRFNLRDNITRVADQIVRDQLDILYVVGGDGSLTGGAADQRRPGTEGSPLPPRKQPRLIVMGAPKTMDNDVLFTDTTFGFTTTVDHLVDAIRTFHHTVECQDHVGVMQVFRRGSRLRCAICRIFFRRGGLCGSSRVGRIRRDPRHSR